MQSTEIEKLNQLISRTDMSGNQKVNWLIEFIENYEKPQHELVGYFFNDENNNEVVVLHVFKEWFIVKNDDSDEPYLLPLEFILDIKNESDLMSSIMSEHYEEEAKFFESNKRTKR